ncbi:TPA: hypothetical protein N0F65_010185 [Lagenidium giganteum]|uniref:Uncharacterized protein n=1 Tax=Lagenidium giganteum TaxID=4803 RepID=A0AAV2ZAZ6_9STRA|nr:TPA: hypothetical protein N0F65_010185 [Lagenidium giganteum]
MVARYIALMGPSEILIASIERHELVPLLLFTDENDAIHALHADTSNLEVVTKLLQDFKLTLSGARKAFDRVMKAYPEMSEKLRPDADIVNNVALESGMVKIIRGEKLSIREAAECKQFEVGPSVHVETDKPPSFLASALKK